MCRERKSREYRLVAVGEGKIAERHIGALRDRKPVKLFGSLHQGLYAFPRDLGFLHRVEEFRYLRGFDGQLRKAGKEGRQRRDVPCVPARPEDVLRPEPEDEEDSCARRRKVERGKRRLPYIALHGGLFVVLKGLLVARLACLLAPVCAVGHGVPRAVEGRGAERTGGFLVCRAGFLYRFLHPRGAEVGDGNEDQAEQREPPIVDEEHHGISDESHTGVEDLGGEFPHSLNAVIDIRDRLCHKLSGTLLFERCPTAADEVCVKGPLHPAVDVVGEAADIEALDEPRRLHREGHGDVGDHKHRHGLCRFVAAEDVGKALREPPLEPRRREQSDIVEKSRDRHEGQRQPFGAEV